MARWRRQPYLSCWLDLFEFRHSCKTVPLLSASDPARGVAQQAARSISLFVVAICEWPDLWQSGEKMCKPSADAVRTEGQIILLWLAQVVPLSLNCRFALCRGAAPSCWKGLSHFCYSKIGCWALQKRWPAELDLQSNFVWIYTRDAQQFTFCGAYGQDSILFQNSMFPAFWRNLAPACL